MKKCNYKIYQFKNDLFMNDKIDYTFEKLSRAVEHGFDKSNPLRDYDEIYSGTLDVCQDNKSDESILEDIWETFNFARPYGFVGHSLSISDIVELNGNLWYCDSIGFTKL